MTCVAYVKKYVAKTDNKTKRKSLQVLLNDGEAFMQNFMKGIQKL